MFRKLKKQWPEYIGIAAFTVALSFLLSLEGTAADIDVFPVATSGNASMIPGTKDEGGGNSFAEGESAVVSSVTDGSKGSISPEKKGGDILSIELPVVPEEELSPFDFFLDPCGLIYETGAVRYGGGVVEEGATMLFCNQEGEYDFSRYSDKLTVRNEDGEPAIVTVSASVSGLGEIALVGQDDFSEYEEPCMYLALTDDQGHEQPILQDIKTTICIEADSGVYSFGLTGACNAETDWQGVSVHPKVKVTWHVEPLPDGEEALEMDGDILLENDIIRWEPAQGDLGELSVDATISRDDEADGITEPKNPSGGVNEITEPENPDGAVNGITEPENPNGGAGGSGQPVGRDETYGQNGSGGGSGNRVSPEETLGNISDLNGSDAFPEGTVSSDVTGNGTFQIPESEGETENSSEAVGKDGGMDGIEQDVSPIP